MRDGREASWNGILEQIGGDINLGAFASGINNILWYSTRRDVEEVGNNAL